jgi:hypothetical protein
MKDLLRDNRGFTAISLIAAMLVLIAACGSESSAPAAGGDEPASEPLVAGTVGNSEDSLEAVEVPADELSEVNTEPENATESADRPAEAWEWEDEEAELHSKTGDAPQPKDPAKPLTPLVRVTPTPTPAKEPTSEDPALTSPTPVPDPTEPPLINTPVPVSNIAPDFTLPSIQGPEYTLSQFRGEKPVAVVFYRAYW